MCALACDTCSYLDNRVEQHNPRLLGDDLFGGEVMLNKLRDGRKARPLKAELILHNRKEILFSFID